MHKGIEMGLTILQLGACVGSDHVSQFYAEGNTLYLVEANAMHIPTLEAAYPDATVIHAAIVPDGRYGDTVTMYYSVTDGPNYEVTSIHRSHLLKHGMADKNIRSFEVATLTLTALLDRINAPIDILFIDIEGVDDDVIRATPLGNYDIGKIQVEMLHLNDMLGMIAYLDEQGYQRTKDTYDMHRYDRIFIRKDN